MKHIFRKTVTELLIAAMLLGTAAGCGLRAADDNASTASTTTSADTELAAILSSDNMTSDNTTSEATADNNDEAEITADNNTAADITSDDNTTASAAETISSASASIVTAEYTAVSATYSTYANGIVKKDELFTERDLAQNADLSDANYVTVSDGATVNITEPGTYVLSGTAAECTVRVEVDDEEKVQLVLNGVTIENTDFPAIYVITADKVFITTAENTENTLSVTGTFRADGETNTDAVIFSKEDLVLNGLGTLTVVSQTGNGITTKDDLKITGGTYQLASQLDTLEANDSIAICGGTFSIYSSKDGLHCENDDDDSLGWIWIGSGTFEITAKSDGIQATPYVQIDGGTFTISASEGIEATYVQINGGTINISASDDGINASRKSTAMSVVCEINGGELTIVMGQGDTDAIDANGSIYVNGGTINITATVSSFDYDNVAEFNGGTIIINGVEVDEIPAEMMGGGMGGFGGGRR